MVDGIGSDCGDLSVAFSVYGVRYIKGSELVFEWSYVGI
jgi:hypothetical protein